MSLLPEKSGVFQRIPSFTTEPDMSPLRTLAALLWLSLGSSMAFAVTNAQLFA
jgi:hypothetical protein